MIAAGWAMLVAHPVNGRLYDVAEYAERFLVFVDWAEADRRYRLADKG